jgi:hypothetical protein
MSNSQANESIEQIIAGFMDELEKWISSAVAEELSRHRSAAPPRALVRRAKVGIDKLIEARRHAAGNRLEIEASDQVACFYCVAHLAPGDVVHWIDGGQTGTCPRCQKASLIGSATGKRMDLPFLEAMRRHWYT